MKLKRMIAAVTVMALFSTTAFAAEIKTEEPKVYTYEEAVALAIKNNSSLSTLEESYDLMEKNRQLTVDSLGAIMMGTLDTDNITVKATVGNTLEAAKTLESNMDSSKYSKELTELSCAYIVRTYFNNIKTAEAGLELAKTNLALEREEYSQLVLKNKLGMISHNALDTAKNSLKKEENNIEQTEFAIASSYSSLGNTLGLKENTSFSIEYDVEYAPLEMTEGLEGYISKAISKAPSVKISELSANLAKSLQNISAYTTSAYGYLEKEYSYASASRNLEDTKNAMKTNITNQYNTIKTTETARESLEAALEDAKQTYDTALTNYNLGNITKLQLEQAELGVKQAEYNILSNTYTHDSDVYKFENPSVMQLG